MRKIMYTAKSLFGCSLQGWHEFLCKIKKRLLPPLTIDPNGGFSVRDLVTLKSEQLLKELAELEAQEAQLHRNQVALARSRAMRPHTPVSLEVTPPCYAATHLETIDQVPDESSADLSWA